MRTILKFLVIILAFLSCRNEEAEKTDSFTSSGSSSTDEKFETFLQKFNRDSTFQINRVHFPLTIRTFDSNFESKKINVTKENYTLMDFSEDKHNSYTREIITEKDKTIIQIRGIENGVVLDAVFQKINGLWKLITLNDQST